jgi:hypothetical protein
MNTKPLISEISRMKSLFSYQKGVVLSEQTTPNQQKASAMGFGPVSAQYAEQLASQGKLSGEQPQQSTQQPQQDANTAEQRLNNIANIYSRADSQGKIKFPGNHHDGWDWSKYVSTYKITQDEITAAKQKAATFPKTPAAAPAPQFVAEKFPLKYMMQGENVKKLQQALGVVNSKGQPNVTGKFYNSTQKALDAKAKELGISYDRNVGLDETSFNEIIQSTQPKREYYTTAPGANRVHPVYIKPPTVPANVTARPTQIQAPQVELTLDQQFQVAKANLDTAKADLDAAQKTGDRVAIGTARGKQQAARQEVRRLRAELFAQNQTPQ